MPSVETLQKFAHALEVPMYQLFYDGETKPVTANSSVTQANLLIMFRRFFSRMEERDRQMLLLAARKLAGAAGRSYPEVV